MKLAKLYGTTYSGASNVSRETMEGKKMTFLDVLTSPYFFLGRLSLYILLIIYIYCVIKDIK